MADRPFLEDILERDGARYARNDHCNGACDRFHERLWNNQIFTDGLGGSHLLRIGARNGLDNGALFWPAYSQRLPWSGSFGSLFYAVDRFDLSDKSVYECIKVSPYQYKK